MIMENMWEKKGLYYYHILKHIIIYYMYNILYEIEIERRES